MPNWCSNSFTLSGPTETINKVVDGISDGKMLQTMADIGKWDYNTAISEWGTKWEVSDVSLSCPKAYGEHSEISGFFESAWSPPKQAFNTFFEQNPDCTGNCLYFEPAMDFCGDLDTELSVSVDITPDFLKYTDLGVQLDEAFQLTDFLEDRLEEAQDEALAEPTTLTDPEEETQ
jgi:hypothetical protein